MMFNKLQSTLIFGRLTAMDNNANIEIYDHFACQIATNFKC